LFPGRAPANAPLQSSQMPTFRPLPAVPDHQALELGVLDWWEREGIFERLQERNRGGPRFSFMDGPITANNPMAAHHCWGRTLKDVFQRYKAMRGFDQRYQNGFDCQGLWVEVGVERELGLNSKKEIEDYGLAEFAARCKERVALYAEVITEQSKRLGMWMDWDNDYYTFSDTNIEYIWRFLERVHENGWLYVGHRSVEWCPRCGTSLSQHELINSYEEITHPSLFVRFPLKGRDRESLVVWTTTPWTLPANVAAAVKPDAEYGLRSSGDWVAVARYPEEEFVRRVPGQELVGLEYEGPFDELPAQAGIVHRVIPWDDVTLEEGTGIVHIAPGAGAEDFELSKVHGLEVLAPIDEAGRFYRDYGEFEGRSTEEVEKPVVVELERRGRLVEHASITHRYPVCWRCATPLVFRIADDWLIACDEIREQMIAANATVDWTPAFYSKRMDDWLRNMGDWNISRRRYFGLPLPFYPCACGHLNVVGSLDELRERATAGLDQLQELHRPWIDEVTIRCEACGQDVRRVTEVGDAWLDAGIVPFSTLGWENDEWIEGGYATGASRGLSGADLPDHAYWEKWFAADWVSEMREQIRLWFYSQSFMSVTLTGRSPYNAVLTYEKLRDETGREMHRSWGNSIDAAEALENMGADVMRWMFCEHVPSQNLKFGYGPANEIKRRVLTLWNSVSFLVTYANIEGFRPTYGDLAGLEVEATPLDRWLLARTRQFVRDAEAEYERFWTPGVVRAFDLFVDDLSNWYIRRSRRRFYTYDEPAFRTLWYAVVQLSRVVAPVLPFLAEHLWQTVVADPCEDAPPSVFLAQWPEVAEVDEPLLAEVAAVRHVVELGRQARATSGIKLRQPLRRLVVQGVELTNGHVDEVADELRVKEVEFGVVEATELRVKPNLPVLGPKLGKELARVQAALQAGDFEELEGGGFRAAGHELAPDEVLVERRGLEGWAVAADDGLTVALDTSLDPELELEGRVYDLIHRLNSMRKDAGLELTDRIRVRLPRSYAELDRHRDWIVREVLAVEIAFDEVDEPWLEKA
jgi:isoleucyl-tRNA synthetase